MSGEGRLRLAVVGDLVEDVVVWTDGPLERGTDNAAQVFRTRGGSAANVAVAAAHATEAVHVRFIGCVGDDGIGDRLAEDLRGAGVEPVLQRRGRTGTIVVLVDAGGERTMLPDRAAAAELGPADERWLDDVDWLHVPAYGLAQEPAATCVRDLMAAAGRRGVRVSIDASSVAVLRELGGDAFWRLVEDVRPRVLLANADEAGYLGIADRARVPGQWTVVKHGRDPVEVITAEHGTVCTPVDPVGDVRDSTGAGDAFAAGLIIALLTGATPEQAARAGCARAAANLGSPGAGSGLPRER